MSPRHFVERLQIHERRRTDAHAIRLYGSVANHVIAQLAFGRFNRMIDFARRGLQHFAYFRHDRAGGNVFYGLQTDQARLPHLFHAHEVAVVGVARGAYGNFKFVLVVGGVGHRFANVPLHAAGAKHRTRGTESNRVFRLQNSYALCTAEPDAVLRQQVLVVLDAWFEGFAETLDVFFQGVVGFVLEPADAKRMRGEARAAIFLENLENLFAFAEAIEERRERANVQRVRSQP